ncbi:MAG: hypothetical protein L3J97_01450, partial [Thermoplasmata archaeon]|nr:hypothetical protein [Thermoplasmata archaeon]
SRRATALVALLRVASPSNLPREIVNMAWGGMALARRRPVSTNGERRGASTAPQRVEGAGPPEDSRPPPGGV